MNWSLLAITFSILEVMHSAVLVFKKKNAKGTVLPSLSASYHPVQWWGHSSLPNPPSLPLWLVSSFAHWCALPALGCRQSSSSQPTWFAVWGMYCTSLGTEQTAVDLYWCSTGISVRPLSPFLSLLLCQVLSYHLSDPRFAFAVACLASVFVLPRPFSGKDNIQVNPEKQGKKKERALW